MPKTPHHATTARFFSGSEEEDMEFSTVDSDRRTAAGSVLFRFLKQYQWRRRHHLNTDMSLSLRKEETTVGENEAKERGG
jgi:hypothetical protein